MKTDCGQGSFSVEIFSPGLVKITLTLEKEKTFAIFGIKILRHAEAFAHTVARRQIRVCAVRALICDSKAHEEIRERLMPKGRIGTRIKTVND